MNPRLLLGLVYAGLIFVASSIPGAELPHIGSKDKFLHTLLYTGFGMVLMWWRMGALAADRTRRALWQAALLGSLYGITDEFHQIFVPGRTPDVRDWMADTVGTLLGAVLIYLMVRTLRSPDGSRAKTP